MRTRRILREKADCTQSSKAPPRNLGGRKISQYLQHPVRQTLQVNMKILLATLISLILCAVAWSLTCYRCGGASPACTSSSKDAVACGDESLPNAEYGCRVYTVNYTSLNSVIDIKGCCFVEDCKKDPCEGSVQGAVCSNVASCQSDKCNYNYTTAMAGPRPTVSSKANIVFYGHQVTALIIFAILYLSM